MKEPTITLPLSEYNKLVVNQFRCDLLKAVKIKKRSRVKQFFLALFAFRREIQYPKFASLCITETYDVLYSNIMGYWGNCINDDMKKNFGYFKTTYKQDAYNGIIKKLNK